MVFPIPADVGSFQHAMWSSRTNVARTRKAIRRRDWACPQRNLHWAPVSGIDHPSCHRRACKSNRAGVQRNPSKDRTRDLMTGKIGQNDTRADKFHRTTHSLPSPQVEWDPGLLPRSSVKENPLTTRHTIQIRIIPPKDRTRSDRWVRNSCYQVPLARRPARTRHVEGLWSRVA